MKINRTALLDAVNTALDEHRARHDTAWQTWHDALVTERARWITEYGPAWAAAADKIRAAADNNEPITGDMLPRTSEWRSDIATWDEPKHSLERPDHTRVRRPGDYRAPAELLAMRSALELITDEEVSHSGLAAIGVSGATFRDALQVMGRVRGGEAVPE